jgi:hypothetical protein
MSELPPESRRPPATPPLGVRPFIAPRHRPGETGVSASSPPAIGRPFAPRTPPHTPLVGLPGAESSTRQPEALPGAPASAESAAARELAWLNALTAPEDVDLAVEAPGEPTPLTELSESTPAWMSATTVERSIEPAWLVTGEEPTAPPGASTPGPQEHHGAAVEEGRADASEGGPVDEFGFPDTPTDAHATDLDQQADPPRAPSGEYVATLEADWGWLNRVAPSRAAPDGAAPSPDEQGPSGPAESVREALPPEPVGTAHWPVDDSADEAPHGDPLRAELMATVDERDARESEITAAESSEAVAQALVEVAARVRRGEVTVHGYRPQLGEAAALAAALAALLNARG